VVSQEHLYPVVTDYLWPTSVKFLLLTEAIRSGLLKVTARPLILHVQAKKGNSPILSGTRKKQ
jgi:hypothetical protein